LPSNSVLPVRTKMSGDKHTKTQQELKITLQLLNILSTFIRVTCFVFGFWGHHLDRGLQKRKIYYKNQFRFCFCQPLGLASQNHIL
jgi:hypothetical protein